MFSELVYKIVLLKKATFPQGIYLLTIKSEPFTIIFLKKTYYINGLGGRKREN